MKNSANGWNAGKGGDRVSDQLIERLRDRRDYLLDRLMAPSGNAVFMTMQDVQDLGDAADELDKSAALLMDSARAFLKVTRERDEAHERGYDTGWREAVVAMDSQYTEARKVVEAARRLKGGIMGHTSGDTDRLDAALAAYDAGNGSDQVATNASGTNAATVPEARIARLLAEATPTLEREQATHRVVSVDTRPLNVGGPELVCAESPARGEEVSGEKR